MKKKKNLHTFGLNVKIERLKKRFTQEELAEHANLSRNSVSLIETGKINPTITKVIDISKALDTSIENLIKGI